MWPRLPAQRIDCQCLPAGPASDTKKYWDSLAPAGTGQNAGTQGRIRSEYRVLPFADGVVGLTKPGLRQPALRRAGLLSCIGLFGGDGIGAAAGAVEASSLRQVAV
jgi:hypothetical protein